MYPVSALSVHDVMDCRLRMRSLFEADTASCVEAAERAVSFFRTRFTDASGGPAFPLVRMFRTQRFEEMEPEIRDYVRVTSPEAVHPNLRCLVLLATAGDEPTWNDRMESRAHLAIPLASKRVVEKAPMISQLILQMGFDVSSVLHPDPSLLLDASDREPGLFYVPEAMGSPYIVAQDSFVRPYGIRSVVGFGWMMAPGDLYAMILFSRVPISAEVADLLKVMGLGLRVSMLPVLRRIQLEAT